MMMKLDLDLQSTLYSALRKEFQIRISYIIWFAVLLYENRLLNQWSAHQEGKEYKLM